MAKKILFLCENSYPNAVVSAQRVHSFMQGLPEWGWSPVMLTHRFDRHNSSSYDPARDTSGQDIRRISGDADPREMTPGRKIRRALRHRLFMAANRIAFAPGEPVLRGYWRTFTASSRSFGAGKSYEIEAFAAAAGAILREAAFDVVYTTSPAAFIHLAGCRVALKHRIPWIAEFRDVPRITGERMGYDEDQVDQVLRLSLRHAAHCITVSEGCREQLVPLAPAEKISVVRNGYVTADFAGLPAPGGRSGVFRVMFAGCIYEQARTEILSGALDLFRARYGECADFRVDFHTHVYHRQVTDRLRGTPGSCFIRHEPILPVRELYEKQCGAAALLVFTFPGLQGIAGTKTYNMLPLRRPVLLLPGDREIYGVLKGTGYEHTVMNTAEDLFRWFSVHYDHFRSTGRLPEPVEVNETACARYSREAQAKNLAAVLDAVVA